MCLITHEYDSAHNFYAALVDWTWVIVSVLDMIIVTFRLLHLDGT